MTATEINRSVTVPGSWRAVPITGAFGAELSGDRIDDCLALARNFGLQLIMAFPEDRLPTMFQHADTVVQCRVERSYDEATEQIQNIENWVVRVEGSRLAELME